MPGILVTDEQRGKTMNTTPGTDTFLLDTSYEGDPRTVTALTLAELIYFLRDNAASQDQYGESHEVHGIYRYDEGSLTELKVEFARRRPDEDDYYYLDYKLVEPSALGIAGPKIVATFSVTIDGLS